MHTKKPSEYKMLSMLRYKKHKNKEHEGERGDSNLAEYPHRVPQGSIVFKG